MLKKSIYALLLALFITTGSGMLTGCNTMEGAGKDTQRAGEKLEDAADRNK